MARVALSHAYDVSAAAVWAVCTDFAALAEVCAPLVAFEGLPSGRIREGQVIEVGVRLFGRLPPRAYRMEVVACDDAAMAFRSRESGAGVRRWDHALRVVPEGAGRSRVEESIEIEAGPATPLFAAWARLLYRHRHRGRLRLLTGETAWRPSRC